MSDPVKVIAKNRKARHEYELLERFEAGLELLGTEVKSLRNGKAQIAEAYVRLQGDEAYLVDAHIQPYTHAGQENHEPTRPRRLLLHRRELTRLRRATQEKGLTIVPVTLYFKGPWAKLEIAVARGKKLHDKRQDIRKREDDRDAQRAMRRY
ncbi:MAG: SsrA-binding protein SmpB [Alphaproteobacteria bacterium]|nr:SsrA-binding protein SmpB [Alphaproteobacteria bacterium]